MMPLPATDGGSRDEHGTSVIPFDRLAGHPLVLMLDIDGTLAPIASRPALARVPDETRGLIASLATRPGVIVVLVSGRAAHDARRLVGVANLWTIGNHGAEVMNPEGEVAVDPQVAPYGEAMARVATALTASLQPLRGVLVENKTWTLSVHHRLADDGILPRLYATVESLVTRNGLRLTDGNKVIEIRPPVAVDKGTAVYRLAGELGALQPGASLFFAGDDITDEDAFRVLRARCPAAVTLQVGDRRATSAEFRVAAPDGVRAVLARIARDHTPST
jgi:trehalose-phosphatase